MLSFFLLSVVACQDKDTGLGNNPTVTEPTTPDPDPDGPLEVSDLVVVEVDGNVLAARVKVNTSKDATASVQFGPADEDLQWQVTSEASLSHDVLVIGMRAERDYSIQVVLTAGDETVTTETTTFTTGTPPAQVARADILAYDADAALDGWTLMDINNNASGAPYTAAMFDMEGYPVWYYEMAGTDAGSSLDVQLTHNTTIALGGSIVTELRPQEIALDGTLIWEGPEQPRDNADGFAHHHFELLENGNYLTLEKVFESGIRGDVIREIAPDYTSVWSWNTFDWLEPTGETDWTHANWTHIADGFVYVSHRHESAVYKIDYATGEVVWRLGEGGDFVLEDGIWFHEQHAPSVLESGNILIYDNAGDNGLARAVEYELDVESWTAREVWSYGGDNADGWVSDYWGDADRLSNGNTLITAGANQLNTVFEVTEDGEIVWQLRHPDGDTLSSMYRSERITPPLIQPL